MTEAGEANQHQGQKAAWHDKRVPRILNAVRFHSTSGEMW